MDLAIILQKIANGAASAEEKAEAMGRINNSLEELNRLIRELNHSVAKRK